MFPVVFWSTSIGLVMRFWSQSRIKPEQRRRRRRRERKMRALCWRLFVDIGLASLHATMESRRRDLQNSRPAATRWNYTQRAAAHANTCKWSKKTSSAICSQLLHSDKSTQQPLETLFCCFGTDFCCAESHFWVSRDLTLRACDTPM